MKIGIMQPYLFPYIGYWQLINTVDEYVILDDVNYIVRGYINRNSILLNGEPKRFTVPVLHASQNKMINDTKLSFNSEEKRKFLETLHMAYAKAPCFDDAYKLIENIILNDTDDLTEYIVYSIKKIGEYLNITTPLLLSSEIKKDSSLKGEERIIAICKELNADTYINPSGGRQLYSHKRFDEENIKLLFLDPRMEDIKYSQSLGKENREFVNSLSIIDVLMFNDVEKVMRFLSMFEFGK